MASAEGGVEIEEVARTNPDTILRLPPHPAHRAPGRTTSGGHSSPSDSPPNCTRTSWRSARPVRRIPRPRTPPGRDQPAGDHHRRTLLALDAKIVLDDIGPPPPSRLEAMRDLNEEEPSEIARLARWASTTSSSTATSAAWSTAPAWRWPPWTSSSSRAASPPTSWTSAAGPRPSKVAAAFHIILNDPNVKAILFNIFGGITRGDEVARGIVEARAGAHDARCRWWSAWSAPTRRRPRDPRRSQTHHRRVDRRRGGQGGRRGCGRGRCSVSILVNRETRLVVQGITGREGEFHTRAMLEFGTNVVAGMTPGKGGQAALDGKVPVFDTVADAVRETGANTSCIFVPAGSRPRRHPGGRECGHRPGRVHHREHPGARHAARLSRPAGEGRRG